MSPTRPGQYCLRSRWFFVKARRLTLATVVLFVSPLALRAQTGNTGYGTGALANPNLTGHNNTGLGYHALFSDTTGSDNTATGAYALDTNNAGSYNTVTGNSAMQENTTGSHNVATGWDALFFNTTGSNNTASGDKALFSNTTAPYNTATGYHALYSNTTNTAVGAQGEENTANGAQALYSNSTGYFNTASGFNALYHNTTGSQNTASGVSALANNTIGANNIAVGVNAGLNLTTGSNNIAVGALGVAGESNTIRIGKQGTQRAAYVQGIYGATVASGVAVRVDSSGHLGTLTSSARFKEGIKPMDKASEAILALEPVTFRYKEELDPDGVTQFGLIAEQVDKVNPELVVRDEKGKVETVRYEAVNAMLLNEFLKEHRKVQSLEATVAQQQKMFETKIAQQQKQIELLTAGLQQVNARIELKQSRSQLTSND